MIKQLMEQAIQENINMFATSAVQNAIRETHQFKVSQIMIELQPREFLFLAAKISRPQDSKLDSIRDAYNNGVKFSDIPYLIIVHEGNGDWKVTGHEGRHRALFIENETSSNSIPVRLMSYRNMTGGSKYLNEEDSDNIKSLITEQGSQTIPLGIRYNAMTHKFESKYTKIYQ